MRSVMVRYKVKPAAAQRNEELVRAVYEELHRRRPDAMSYATFKLDDGVSFVHVHVSANDDGSSALAQLPAFQEFQRGAAERCQEGPVVTQLRAVGSYGFRGGGDLDKL